MNPLAKSAVEIDAMREGGKILARVLEIVSKEAKPGISTADLDKLAYSKLLSLGAKPSFLGYKNDEGQSYPASLCTSVNNEVVHGIPGANKILKEGDIVGLDLGCWYKNMCTDMAITVPVGNISAQAKKLIKVSSTALTEAIKYVRAGAAVGDISHCIETYVATNGFSVVKKLTGHGVGKAVHEEPAIPNFGRAGYGHKLVAGMTIAIEPMVNAGDYEVATIDDGWTVVTVDGSLSAHFEHTVLVTDRGCEILTKV